MRRPRRLGAIAAAAAAALVVVAAGAGGAIAAAGGTHHHPAAAARAGFANHRGPGPLTAAASYLGLTAAELRTQLQPGKTLAQIADATSGKSAAGLADALVADAKTKLDAAVTAGRLSQAQEDAMLAELTQHVSDFVNGVHPAGPPPGDRHNGGPLTAASSYLGLTAAELRTQLQSGKTLAQIADATSGKSAAGLADALVADAKTKLDAAVTAGRLSQAQEDAILADLKQHVTDLVDGVRPTGPPPGGDGRPHHPGI